MKQDIQAVIVCPRHSTFSSLSFTFVHPLSLSVQTSLNKIVCHQHIRQGKSSFSLLGCHFYSLCPHHTPISSQLFIFQMKWKFTMTRITFVGHLNSKLWGLFGFILHKYYPQQILMHAEMPVVLFLGRCYIRTERQEKRSRCSFWLKTEESLRFWRFSDVFVSWRRLFSTEGWHHLNVSRRRHDACTHTPTLTPKNRCHSNCLGSDAVAKVVYSQNHFYSHSLQTTSKGSIWKTVRQLKLFFLFSHGHLAKSPETPFGLGGKTWKYTFWSHYFLPCFVD